MRTQAYKYDTGQKNRRITIETWGTTQDEGGGSTGSVVSSYSMWANVKNRNGRLIEAENQRQWPFDYEIRVRYETSRPINEAQTITYDGKRLQINSLTIDTEGMREEYIIGCSTTGSAGTVLTGPGVDQTTGTKTFKYTATASGTIWTDSSMKNRNVLLAFKDGVEFDVITSGTPTGKQVLYTSSTGSFEWSVTFEVDDKFLIQYT